VRVLALSLITACWKDPAPVIVPPSTNLVTIDAPNSTYTPMRPSSPYTEVAGTWIGVGYQYDTKGHWNIEMTLQKRGEIGDVIGSVVYEDGCTADLIRQPEGGDRGETLVMREKLVTGQGKCVDNGMIRIPRRPTVNELDWRWDFSSGKEGASATVKRE